MLLKLLVIFGAFTQTNVITFGFKIHVIDGEEAKAHSIPWQLSMVEIGWHICGASLLAVPCMENESNIVLTAAHCLSKPNEDGQHDVTKLFVLAGKHDLEKEEPGQVRSRVAVAISHEHHVFKKNETDVVDDIAILKLETPIRFSDTIQPIYLPKHPANVNQTCLVAGWGFTRKAKGDGEKKFVVTETTKLQKLDVRVATERECHQVYRNVYNTTGMICDTRLSLGKRETFGTICSGDSGGALACKEGNRFVVHGVVSGTNELCNAPAMYCRVSAKLQWIQDTLKMLGICQYGRGL